ncbi:hypothetical protein HGP13_34180 [Mesorhizobium sp. NZP2077]|uniref:hypothetical protein n=1 Tax=Mesorhizobium sp. NZP2077 TaxID=2483404 RepID=UPI001551BF13|nr:hypothetical protein [Mesorhizobium sp. NZP2077]QKD19590.1 hypothetical protein HGP13_34180 [Mesorhizobium sp. NZP2077]
MRQIRDCGDDARLVLEIIRRGERASGCEVSEAYGRRDAAGARPPDQTRRVPSPAKAAEAMSRLEFLLDIAWPGLRASSNFDVSNEALPHMRLLEENYLERPCASFAYAGASVGDEVWSRLIEAGTPFREALGALRVEKGTMSRDRRSTAGRRSTTSGSVAWRASAAAM